jgi:uncharacterized protein (TIGR02001 family)
MKQAKLLTSTLAAAVLVSGVGLTSVANADVSASVSIANMYLWRGYDLSNGSAAVSGDIGFSTGSDAFSLHGDLWTSSGDDGWGTEYDAILGFGGSSGDFSYDLTYVSYVYPNTEALGNMQTGLGDFSEVIGTLGYGPVSFSYYENVGDASPGGKIDSYNYMTLSASFGKFSALIGRHDDDSGLTPTHLDLSYSFNDNLSFTVSKWISDEPTPDDAHFVFSYSLPLE